MSDDFIYYDDITDERIIEWAFEMSEESIQKLRRALNDES